MISKSKRGKETNINSLNENAENGYKPNGIKEDGSLPRIPMQQLNYTLSPRNTSLQQTEFDSHEATNIDTKNNETKKQSSFNSSQLNKYLDIFKNEQHQSVISSKRKSSYHNSNKMKSNNSKNNNGDLSNYYQLMDSNKVREFE